MNTRKSQLALQLSLVGHCTTPQLSNTTAGHTPTRPHSTHWFTPTLHLLQPCHHSKAPHTLVHPCPFTMTLPYPDTTARPHSTHWLLHSKTIPYPAPTTLQAKAWANNISATTSATRARRLKRSGLGTGPTLAPALPAVTVYPFFFPAALVTDREARPFPCFCVGTAGW
ncbi:hypothetical protein E2C01_081070 [Portunus trituberculatus]|uniref:Uncharacterized protein n=1 Tax=Portunus trituberculatus TaxID=210409 RepID=A0A5B7IXQ2_PORTR|nr:hypothetical protein [Portunus trituberculatus]